MIRLPCRASLESRMWQTHCTMAMTGTSAERGSGVLSSVSVWGYVKALVALVASGLVRQTRASRLSRLSRGAGRNPLRAQESACVV